LGVNDLPLFLAGMVLALVLLLLLAWKIFRMDDKTKGASDETDSQECAVEPEVRAIGKDASVTCQMCLGEVEGGGTYRICPCGKPFHAICITRTGFCPYCNRPFDENEFLMRQMEGEAKIIIDSCPVCGRATSGDRCECGALFADVKGELVCPTCGGKISSEEDACKRCGEVFETLQERLCPVCLNAIHEGQTICRCGLVLDDLCPECGWKLGTREDSCPICGLDFELVSRRDDLY